MDKQGKRMKLSFFNVENLKDEVKSIDVDEKGRKWGCLLTSLAFLFVLTGLLLGQIFMPIILKTSKEIKVPDVTGITISQARTNLELAGLDMRIAGEEYSENVPSGIVISQNPLPNSSIKFNKIVEVIVSKGSEKISVPYVKGLHISNATDMLLKNGIIVNDTNYVFDNNYAENIVVGSEPPENSLISKGGTISLYVSKGKIDNYVQIPNFVGLSSDSAILLSSKLLKYLNLKIDTIRSKGDNYYVIKQVPDSGQYLKKDDTLKIILKGR